MDFDEFYADARNAGMSDEDAREAWADEEAVEYTADIGPADDDGFTVVIIQANGEDIGRYTIRSDMVRQWTVQELAILNERGVG